MRIIEYFCKHKYNRYAEKIYDYETIEVVPGTEHWEEPLTEKQYYSLNTEVLICEKCGKIEIIEY